MNSGTEPMNRSRIFQAYLPLTVLLFFSLLFPVSAKTAKKPEVKIPPAALKKLSPAMQEELAGLHYILNAYQARQLLSLENDSLRAEWLRIFWKSQDPTPTTSYNEKLIEHTVRVRLARQFFTIDKWPGWDKRGEVFIRYGPPDYRGKVWGEVTSHKVRPPGELWFYRQHNMLVSFQNYGLTGEYIYSINPLGSAQDLSPELIEFLLYDTDQSLTSKIPQNFLELYSAPQRDEDTELTIKTRDPMADPNLVFYDPSNRLRIKDLPESIDAIMNQDYKAAIPKDVSMVFKRDEVEEVANNFEKTLEETPSSYPFNFTHKPLPFYFSVDQFKGGRSINRIEVNIEVPVYSEKEDSMKQEKRFKATAVVWDARYNELNRSERELVLRAERGTKSWSKLIPTQLVFSLAEGYYRFGIAVESEATEESTTYKTSVSSEHFGGKLAISDLLFSSRIARAEESSMWSRGPLHVIPHPSRVYKKAFSVPVYFEAYNLGLDESGMSSYTVEYKVIPHSKKKFLFWERYETAPIVSSSFHASGYNPDEMHFFRLGTENLSEGSFDLLVTVTDEINHTVAYRKATFSIID